MSDAIRLAPAAAQPKVVIVGAGPAGLAAAERAAAAGCAVDVFERMASPARKFLLAGRGGLNLTHSEPLEGFLCRYGAAGEALGAAIRAFPPEALRAWSSELGVDTFVGTSGRVFPSVFKASPLLRAWLGRLARQGVRIHPRHLWTGFSEAGAARFETAEGAREAAGDAVVLALGGASWPRLGSDGTWAEELGRAGLPVSPLRPANCGFIVDWSPAFAGRFAGAPIKRAALTFEGVTVRGEAVAAADGLEGGMIYALSARLRDAIARGAADEGVEAALDLRPDLDAAALARKLAQPRGKRSLSTHLAKAVGLSQVAIALLREAGPPRSDPEALAHAIKATTLRFRAPKPIDRAISTAGGVGFDGLDASFMSRARPGLFVAGEMLDWEAPTGGYLLQACFATGFAAGDAAARWALARRQDAD
ncbi:TIGR03862 family flavoprotein [Chenggangzhangella methanolivorans]|uniref:TIGR03862 family flavoprotein n=1 Tax=Chenggangzhangella methanolivorans TaxID=1437009 RepID=A0A9E6UNW3_9HYPH|nr:TIGR03862 family flavoprotein [Chenggangzhangella methanolivorans]QZO00709.1 TIGR03862 family flavoprotein [Chenggangzhangella methanolivorans]